MRQVYQKFNDFLRQNHQLVAPVANQAFFLDFEARV
jgi:hypothetical protein